MSTKIHSSSVKTDYEKFIACMSELAFIRGYVRSAITERHQPPVDRILRTIEERCTKGLLEAGIEPEAA